MSFFTCILPMRFRGELRRASFNDGLLALCISAGARSSGTVPGGFVVELSCGQTPEPKNPLAVRLLRFLRAAGLDPATPSREEPCRKASAVRSSWIAAAREDRT